MSSGWNINADINRDLYRTQREEVLDHSWLKNTFILGGGEEDAYNKWLKANRFFSTADIKTGSTAPGMGLGVNQVPQWCRTTDIRRPGLLGSRDTKKTRITGVPSYDILTPGHQFGLGYGRWYSEMIDDNQQRIFLRFGEPQYFSMLLWLGKSFDVSKAVLFKRGFISRTLISAIETAATFFAIAAAPIIFAGKVLLEAIIQPGRFISVRDNMYTYWTMVETILNSMYIRRTNVPFKYPKMQKGMDTTIGQPISISPHYVQGLSEMIPGVIDPDNGRISVWTIALRGQTAFNRAMADNIDKTNEDNITTDPANYRISEEKHDSFLESKFGKPWEFTKWLMTMAFGTIGNDQYQGTTWKEDMKDMWDRLGQVKEGIDNFLANGSTTTLDDEDDLPFGMSMNERSTSSGGDELKPVIASKQIEDMANYIEQTNYRDPKKKAQMTSYTEYLMAELSSGSSFAVFNVDNTGSSGESFNNASETSPIETVFNAASSKVRQFHNSIAGALEVPIIGDMIKLGADAAAATISGASMGLANPLLALAYGTTISLPKTWSTSSASLPRASYKMRLTSCYGNSYSQLFNMYLPLAMILAGSLPRKTGSDTHTAPFMLQLFDRGRVNIPFGMVESVSITRGVSNLAFNRSGQPNAIDVDLNIVDLNQIIALDVDGTGLLTRAMSQLRPDFSDDAITTYINTITGVDVYTMFYAIPNLRLKLIEREMTLKALVTDKAAHSAFLVNAVPGLNSITGLAKDIFGRPAVLREQQTIYR